MGIFDKLNTILEKAEEFVEEQAERSRNVSGAQATAAQPTAAQPAAAQPARQSGSRPVGPTPADWVPPALATPEQVKYFTDIIAEYFPAVTVRQRVPLSEFGGEGKAFDLLLESGGRKVGAIMLTQANRTNNRQYKGAMAAAAANGIPFFNFFLQMRNDRDYVVERLRDGIR